MTVNELKKFLETLPESFDDFEMVNGEISMIGEDTYVRVDKPILSLQVDEENKEFCCLHKTEEEIIKIIKL